jgi:hypothetical protein
VSLGGLVSNSLVPDRLLASLHPPEGKWKGNACTGCKNGSQDMPAAGRNPQKRLVFMHCAHAAHRRRRFSIGKQHPPFALFVQHNLLTLHGF